MQTSKLYKKKLTSQWHPLSSCFPFGKWNAKCPQTWRKLRGNFLFLGNWKKWKWTGSVEVEAWKWTEAQKCVQTKPRFKACIVLPGITRSISIPVETNNWKTQQFEFCDLHGGFPHPFFFLKSWRLVCKDKLKGKERKCTESLWWWWSVVFAQLQGRQVGNTIREQCQVSLINTAVRHH